MDTILACDGAKYYEISGAVKSNDTPIEEVAGAGITKEMILHSLIDQLAALHYFHWNDSSMFEKYPYLKQVEFYQGKNKDGYKEATEKEFGMI